MKEREAAGNALMDTTVGEGSLNPNPCRVQEASCPTTKVSQKHAVSDIEIVFRGGCNIVCAALNLNKVYKLACACAKLKR